MENACWNENLHFGWYALIACLRYSSIVYRGNQIARHTHTVHSLHIGRRLAAHSVPSVAQIPETEPAAAERDYGISSTAQLELPGEDNGGGSQPSCGIHLGTRDRKPHAG